MSTPARPPSPVALPTLQRRGCRRHAPADRHGFCLWRAGSGTVFAFVAGHRLGRIGIPFGTVRGGRRRGVERHGLVWVAADRRGGDARGVRTGVLRSGDGPVMRGVRGVGQVLELATAGMVGSVTAECGRRVRGQGGAELAAASISLFLSRVHRLRTPAPPPRSRAVWDGRHPLQPPLRRPGAEAPVMAGEAPAVRRAP